MKNVDSIIEKIKKEHIKPTPKWVFTLRNGSVWFLFALSVLIGMVATSVIIYAFNGVYEEVLEHAGHSIQEKILLLFPVFWIISLILFTVLAIILGKKTKTGYRYPIYYYLIAAILISSLGGYIIYKAGGSEKIEEIFSEKLNLVQSTEERRMAVWSRPEDGYLSGTISSIDQNALTIIDFDDTKWHINTVDAFVRPSVDLAIGTKIKVLGEIQSSRKFKAEEIRPWVGKGGGQGKGRGGKIGR